MMNIFHSVDSHLSHGGAEHCKDMCQIFPSRETPNITSTSGVDDGA